MQYNSYVSARNTVAANYMDSQLKVDYQNCIIDKTYPKHHSQLQGRSNPDYYNCSESLKHNSIQLNPKVTNDAFQTLNQYEHTTTSNPFNPSLSDVHSTLPLLYMGKEIKPVNPTKRAAQNRAAQRAFRLRKERYVKDLEQRVKHMSKWQAEIERLRQENHRLRLELGKPATDKLSLETVHAFDLERAPQATKTVIDSSRNCPETVNDNSSSTEIDHSAITTAFKRRRTLQKKAKAKPNTSVRLLPRQTETSLKPIRLYSPEHIGVQCNSSDCPPLPLFSSSSSNVSSDNSENGSCQQPFNKDHQYPLSWEQVGGSNNVDKRVFDYQYDLPLHNVQNFPAIFPDVAYATL